MAPGTVQVQRGLIIYNMNFTVKFSCDFHSLVWYKVSNFEFFIHRKSSKVSIQDLNRFRGDFKSLKRHQEMSDVVTSHLSNIVIRAFSHSPKI